MTRTLTGLTLMLFMAAGCTNSSTDSTTETAAAATLADIQPLVGIWKLNVDRSKYSPGSPPRSQTTVIEETENGIHVVVDSVNADGTSARNEIRAKFDGKQYEYTGAVQPTTRVYRRIDDRTVEWVSRVNGTVTTTTRSEVSADGKTRTNTSTGTNPDGQSVNNVVVYEKR